jgi:hypothetical protein
VAGVREQRQGVDGEADDDFDDHEEKIQDDPDDKGPVDLL